MNDTSPSSSGPAKNDGTNDMFPGEAPDPNLSESPEIEGQFADEESGGAKSWLIWGAALVGFNVCSWAFDWPFWIY